MRMRIAVVLAAAALAGLPGPAGAAASLRVTSASVCPTVDDECHDVEQSFGEGVSALWFVTVVEGATGEAWVEHVWRRDGHEVFRMKLPIRKKRSRTASRKTVSGMPGEWTAVVLDPVGRELAKVSFQVQGPGAPQ